MHSSKPPGKPPGQPPGKPPGSSTPRSDPPSLKDPDSEQDPGAIADRFRGFLPVVVDVETGGFDARTDALLEISAVILEFDENKLLRPAEQRSFAVEPAPGMNLEPSALEFTGIDPGDPDRGAVPERTAMTEIFQMVRHEVKKRDCQRAVLVGHNAHFDQGFLNAAALRCGIKRNPFHPFSCLDTVSFAALAYGQTVLSRACSAAGIDFRSNEAHSAAYDADRTAVLFCTIVNRWTELSLHYERTLQP